MLLDFDGTWGIAPACRGNASFFAQSVPERLQNEGIVHALDPQKPLFAGLSLPLFLAVDGRNVGLHHVLLPPTKFVM